MNAILSSNFINAVDTLKDNTDGTVYYKLGKVKGGKELCLVFGWQEGYENNTECYQKQVGDTVLTLCSKLAFNIDDLQCDYDVDWYMPYNPKTGDVLDTDTAVKSDPYEMLTFYNKYVGIIEMCFDNGDLTI